MSGISAENTVQALTVGAMDCRDRGAVGLIDGLSGRVVLSRLRKIRRGCLVVRRACEEFVCGEHDSAAPAILNVHNDRFFVRLLADGAMGAAESYMDGEWSSPDLTALFRTLLQNEHVLGSMRPKTFSPAQWLRRLNHFRSRNSQAGSRRNIHEHYDLGNEFFALFLDPSMMYSSAIFADQQTDLETASWEKVDRVCRSLQLTPGDDVVEIGTGWGGFALHAASKYGCRVTTTTISEEQHAFATRRIRHAGLEDRVVVLNADYRELTGKYDKLVSLEMVEAVGRQYLPEYFATCDRLIKDDGAMMLQAITMPEQSFDRYAKSVDFIQKYIFPGGFLPSVSELQRCVQEQTSLRLLQLDDFGMHYAQTLNHWNRRFHDRIEEVSELGFSDRFVRMWRYYLCYCEAAFLERATGLMQAVWAKPGSRLGRI